MSNTVVSSVASEGWVETTLGELADYITSGSRDWSKYYADSGAIFIRTQDINRNRLSLNEVAFVKLPEKVEGKRSLVRKGDLLVTITGANVGKVAVVEGEIPEAYVSQSVCLVRLKDPSLAKFVHLQLTAKRGDKTTVEAMAYGLGRPVLNLENIRSAPIRIAPPKAQALMVAEIEKQFSRLDEAVANLKRVKANLKRYKAAVLKAAVQGKLTEDWRKQHPDVEPASKLIERILAERRAKSKDKGNYIESASPDIDNLPALPKGWIWTSLGQMFEVYVGATPSRGKQEYWDGSIPWVSSGEVAFCRIRKTKERITEKGLANSSAKLHPQGTVLLGMIGEGKTRGQVAILDIAACNNQNSAAIRVSETGIPSEYVYRYLEGQYEDNRLLGSGNNQPALNKARVQRIPFPLPPTSEQQQIVGEVERRLSVIKELEAAVEADLTRADRLRQSLLARAFRGELCIEAKGAKCP